MLGEGYKRKARFHGGPWDGQEHLVELRRYIEAAVPLPQRPVSEMGEGVVDMVLRYQVGTYRLVTTGYVKGGELYHEYDYYWQDPKLSLREGVDA